MKPIGVLLVLTLFCFTSMQAQQHRERWKVTDFFPEHHFVPPNAKTQWDSTRTPDKAGEVAFYMRLAGLQPWKDTSHEEALTLIRVSMLPQYSHPMFISLAIFDDSVYRISLRRGNAICGYVEHSTYMELSDTGYYDATEEHYKGNLWMEGMIDDQERELTAEQVNSLNRLLVWVDLPHHPHTTRWGGRDLPYVIEYRHGKTYNAIYGNCCHREPLDTLVNYLVFLSGANVRDNEIHYKSEAGITPAQFPGGDSAYNAFLAENLRYPKMALAELEEGEGTLKFIVETDGSLFLIESSKDKYGFSDEAKRLFYLMPRWQPAMDIDRPVRNIVNLPIRFTLPDSLQPVYGSPILETKRDTNKWKTIYASYRRLLGNPQNQEHCYWLARQYYGEFLLPMKARVPNSFDSAKVEWGEETWGSILDNTPVIKGAADSALRYFYRALTATQSVDDETLIDMYLPIRQLEQYLGLPYNPLNKLPYDTVPGIYYPYSYFIDLPADGHLDSTVDVSLSSAYFWAEAFSRDLTAMSEPVLYDSTLTLGDTVFRFAFYPSFHPPLCFRVERSDNKSMLYWTKLDYTIDEHSLSATYYPIQGSRNLSKQEYSKLMQIFADLDFDHKGHINYTLMMDGAQWVIERRTADTFKAYFTNLGGMKIDALYSYLISLSGIEAGYASEYCD
ncbi:MAG: energy transducer TonB [Bacteroidales bacterium]|nr:energy transducer TonB [Bacteroidales bacterium]